MLNHKVIEEEAEEDGFFGIITNVKEMIAMGIVSNYKELWRIEDSFGEMKGTMKSRPCSTGQTKGLSGILCFVSCHFTVKHTLPKSSANQEWYRNPNQLVKEYNTKAVNNCGCYGRTKPGNGSTGQS